MRRLSWVLDVRLVLGRGDGEHARGRLAELIDSARRTGDPVDLTRCGGRVAVLLDPDVYERLLEKVEDAVDRAELRAAREDADHVPRDEVKADVGLT